MLSATSSMFFLQATSARVVMVSNMIKVELFSKIKLLLSNYWFKAINKTHIYILPKTRLIDAKSQKVPTMHCAHCKIKAIPNLLLKFAMNKLHSSIPTISINPCLI